MSLTKYASIENVQVLDLKGSQDRVRHASLGKLADFQEYRTSDGYLYARIRAISSRVNKNHDGWPSVELAGGQDIFDRHHSSSDGFTVTADSNREYGFSTFLGKPIFVDHHNSDPNRARGVIVDAKFHVDDHKTASLDPYYSSPDVDPEHLPGTWVELLLEVDAKAFPKFAKAIVEGSRNPKKGIDGWSMGCDVENSVCSICKNSATSPEEYCTHIKMKGAYFDYIHPKGHKTSRKAYENCYGVKFFEISGVFDPADETALSREVRASKIAQGFEYAEPGENPELDQWASDLQDARARQQEHLPEGQSILEVMRAYMMGDPEAGQLLKRITGIEPDVFIEQGRRMFAPRNDGYDDERLAYVASQVVAKSQEETITQDPREKSLKDLADEQAEEFLEESGKKRRKQATPLPSGAVECPNCAGDGFDEVDELNGPRDCPMCGGHGALYTQHPGSDGSYTPGRLGPADMTDYSINDPERTRYGPVRQGSVHLAENPMPQSEMSHAPEHVDTLREEEICPVCGSSMDEDTCDVCGYQEPPDGFGNPDLTKAQDVDVPVDKPDDARIDIPQDTPQEAGSDIRPVNTPNNPTALAHVTSEMDWEVHEKTSARINKVERPIVATDKPATNEPNEQVISDQIRPVTSNVRTAEDFIAAVANKENNNMEKKVADSAPPSNEPRNKGHHPMDDARNPEKVVDVVGVGGVIEPSNEEASKANAQVDVLGIGGSGVESVSAEEEGAKVDQGDEHSKNIEAIHTDTWHGNEGDSLGQHEPVTTEVPQWVTDSKWSHWRVEGHEDGPLEQQEQQGGSAGWADNQPAAVKGVKPADPVGNAEDRVNVLETVTTPDNNSGPTKTWNGTEGNGVTKQQEPVTDESIALGESGLEGKPNWSVASHIFTAFKLADLEVNLGLIPEDQKYPRAAELENESPAVLSATLKYAQRIKRTAARKTAGVQKLPVMGRPTSIEKETSTEPQETRDDHFMFGGV